MDSPRRRGSWAAASIIAAWVGTFLLTAGCQRLTTEKVVHKGIQQDYGTSDTMRIGAGQSHSCAIDTYHMVKCWGGNSYGQAMPPPGLSNCP